MNIPLSFMAVLLPLLLTAAVFRRHWLLAGWMVALLVLPTAQIKIGPIPLYLYDLMTVLLLIAFFFGGEARRWPSAVPRWHWWFIGSAFFLSVLFGFALHGFLPDIVWIWGHSSLAWTGFAFGVLVPVAAARPQYRASLQAGLLASAALLALVAVIQYADLSGTAFLSHLFYGAIGSEESVEILRRGETTNRAMGPHFAPTGFAGIALLGCITFWIVSNRGDWIRRGMMLILTTTIVWCTVSRHALVAVALGMIVIVALSSGRDRIRHMCTGVGTMLIIASAGMVVSNGWMERLARFDAGVLEDDNIAARLIWGPERLIEYFVAHPLSLLTGAGLDPEKLASKGGIPGEAASGFVSNGFLLAFYYMGVFGFVLYGAFWLWAMWMASRFSGRARAAACGSVVIAIVIVAADNYSFMYEPAACFLFLVVGLIAGERHLNTFKELHAV